MEKRRGNGENPEAESSYKALASGVNPEAESSFRALARE